MLEWRLRTAEHPSIAALTPISAQVETKMKLVVALCLAAPAAGFGFGKKGAKAAPKAQKRSSSGAQYPSVALPWTTTPLDGSLVGDVGFDPLGFSTAFEPYFPLSYLREAEIKHGRVCMLAWLGYVLVDAGFRAPGAGALGDVNSYTCLLYTSPSPRDRG